jgi:hypothetical protein
MLRAEEQTVPLFAQDAIPFNGTAPMLSLTHQSVLLITAAVTTHVLLPSSKLTDSLLQKSLLLMEIIGQEE